MVTDKKTSDECEGKASESEGETEKKPDLEDSQVWQETVGSLF